MKKITIKDIAREAGVSVSVVSYALNNTGYVNKERKEKIKKIASKYNYNPSYMAKAIRTKKTKNIALVINEFSPYIKNIELVDGIEGRLRDYGYCLNIFNTKSKIKKYREIIKTIKNRIIDGVILQGAGIVEEIKDKDFNELRNSKIPLLFVEKPSNDLNIPTVEINGYKGGKLAGELLMESNHKNIGILTYPISSYIFKERVNGFKDSLKSNKLKPKFIKEIYSELFMLKPTLDWLESAKDILLSNETSAIFCTADLIAVALLEFYKNNEIRVPQDISIVGYDNHIISKTCSPKLTTVNNDLKRLGEIAVDNLISIIEKQILLEKNYILEPDIRVRESVYTI